MESGRGGGGGVLLLVLLLVVFDGSYLLADMLDAKYWATFETRWPAPVQEERSLPFVAY
jgi:hypothetical protein